jgi:hypothetical protein
VGQEPQEHDSDGYEHEPDEIVQVNAVPRTQGHPEEDRVEAVRVEPDDGGPDRDREDSEHPPQGSLRVPGTRTKSRRAGPAFGVLHSPSPGEDDGWPARFQLEREGFAKTPFGDREVH